MAVFGFRNAPSGNYYVVVKHRNSVETWSKSGGIAYTVGGNLNYDFTTSASQAFGNNLQLVGGKYCIYTGDVNQDGVVSLPDVIDIYNSASIFATGYLNTDIDGNNNIDLNDITMAYNNSINFVTVIKP